eukprot:1158559-Pelagomonas_calceolata.AAC.1
MAAQASNQASALTVTVTPSVAPQPRGRKQRKGDEGKGRERKGKGREGKESVTGGYTHFLVRTMMPCSHKRVEDLKAEVAAARYEAEAEKQRTAKRLMVFEAEIDRLRQGVRARCCPMILSWTAPGQRPHMQALKHHFAYKAQNFGRGIRCSAEARASLYYSKGVASLGKHVFWKDLTDELRACSEI